MGVSGCAFALRAQGFYSFSASIFDNATPTQRNRNKTATPIDIIMLLIVNM